MPEHGHFDDTAGFLLTIPLLKSWRDDDGAPRFEGVAASTSLDRQSERLTVSAIEKMQEYGGIDLLPSHSAGPLEELGVVEKCWVDNSQFRIAGRLDPTNLEAMRLYEKLQTGKRYGLSVGGRVLKAHWQFDEAAGRRVKFIDDVALDHVAVCRPAAAANPDTYLTVLAKAAETIITDGPDSGDSAAASASCASSASPDGASDPLADDAAPDEAVFIRLGKAIIEACRGLWPFGAEAPQPPADDATADAADDAATPDPLPAMQKRIEELDRAVAQLHKTLAQRQPPAEPPQPEVIPGRPQAIPGQNKPQDHKHTIWKGVL